MRNWRFNFGSARQLSPTKQRICQHKRITFNDGVFPLNTESESGAMSNSPSNELHLLVEFQNQNEWGKTPNNGLCISWTKVLSVQSQKTMQNYCPWVQIYKNSSTSCLLFSKNYVFKQPLVLENGGLSLPWSLVQCSASIMNFQVAELACSR